ncbi:FAD-dependent oxidoreductase [Salinisphaera hydrothermalis]|uniref:Pyridine nucleotide-disulfide oxidoreductase n=1 Tax=Salinisphaera hydrothermalis (strain C41B8) TaxID=1304275 RepID=A0A084IPS9_SALHC|nr:bifunctional TVP38/TMEM64 family protein/FAD-dependent oxidoreductase [Salinisphaera hydrothermalis]KEZ78713.1 hypothetical protein C41B8_03821 [Salinisphaera hydrothermalis C41B8]
MTALRVSIAVALVAAVIAFFALGLGQYLDLAYLKSRHAELAAVVGAHELLASTLFFVAYVAMAALSLPGAAVMTLAGGALFGVAQGVLLVSFASSIGATLAFLAARFVLRDWVQRRYGQRLAAIDRGVNRDGAFYLFSLRLVPVFPFFIINLLMGLTALRATTFYWVSQLGMLPGTLVYVYAGTRLAAIQRLGDVLSPGLIVAFVLLGLFPLIARWVVAWLQRRRRERAFAKPRRFDRNLIVIGAGSAGLVTAYIAATVRARVTLIERHRMGGDCLNYGCVPSKTLIRSARVAALMRRGTDFGVQAEQVRVDFAAVMARVREAIARIAPHDSIERYTSLGVEVIEGEARLTSPWSVAVDGRELTARGIVIATGARPRILDLPGLDTVAYLTSDTVWNLTELPARLVVLGGGPIACELGQAFARFGSRVTIVQRAAQLLTREDTDVSERARSALGADGVDVCTGHVARAVTERDGESVLLCEHDGRETAYAFDRLLIAVGRTPNTEGLGLEALGIETGRALAVNEFLQTGHPSILACGDVAGPFRFTHAAAHQAWHAAVNALFGGVRRFKVDYSVIPEVTYTEPEIARVGLNETRAARDGIAYEVTHYDLDGLDRMIIDGASSGFIKVLTRPGRDVILGVTIVGDEAGELIGEFVTAMRHGLGLNKILGTIHAYPTRLEANKYVAGEWKRAHAPAWILAWLGRWHTWRRHDRRRS